MDAAIYSIAAIVAAVAIYPALRILIRSYLRFRGTRLVTCPETKQCAAVEVGALRAALTRLLGSPALRLEECSRWPERRDCGQQCLQQIESAPEDCLLRTILTRWYENKTCVYCGKSLGRINWLEHQPSLRSPQGVTVEWGEIRPEKVPDALTTHQPVCWDCHIAQIFRRLYPDMVLERPHREHVPR